MFQTTNQELEIVINYRFLKRLKSTVQAQFEKIRDSTVVEFTNLNKSR